MPWFLKQRILDFLCEDLVHRDSRGRLTGHLKAKRAILDLGALKSSLTDTTDPTATTVYALDALPAGEFGFGSRVIRKLQVRPNVRMLFGDGERLPFRPGSFDLVIATEVLEHIRDDAAAVSEIGRVLQDGGTVFVTVPHLDRVPLDCGIKEHFRHYTRTALLGLFSADFAMTQLVERFRGREEDGPLPSLREGKRSPLVRFFLLGVDLLWNLYFLHIHAPVRSRWIPYRRPGSNLVLVGRRSPAVRGDEEVRAS